MSTEQEIIFQNKVIAEFDGWEPRLQSKGQNSKTPLWYKPSAGYAAFDLSAMKYHSDWSWIMPVWVRFRDLVYPHEQYMIFIQILFDHIPKCNTPQDLLDRLYPAILWYNSQKETIKP